MEYGKLRDVKLFIGEKVICEHCGWPKRFNHKDTERLICNNCHRWIYKDEKTKLKYENKEKMNKLKRILIF